MNKFRIRVEAQNYGRYFAVLLTNGRRVGKTVEWVDVPDHAYREPTIRLEKTAAQELMDDLWQCGIRPSEGTGSAGAMRATEKHLTDMRRLVFDKET